MTEKKSKPLFHLTNGQWKMVETAQGTKKLPLFHTTQYYNRFCKGNALKTILETEASVPNFEGTYTIRRR